MVPWTGVGGLEVGLLAPDGAVADKDIGRAGTRGAALAGTTAAGWGGGLHPGKRGCLLAGDHPGTGSACLVGGAGAAAIGGAGGLRQSLGTLAAAVPSAELSARLQS